MVIEDAVKNGFIHNERIVHSFQNHVKCKLNPVAYSQSHEFEQGENLVPASATNSRFYLCRNRRWKRTNCVFLWPRYFPCTVAQRSSFSQTDQSTETKNMTIATLATKTNLQAHIGHQGNFDHIGIEFIGLTQELLLEINCVFSRLPNEKNASVKKSIDSNLRSITTIWGWMRCGTF